MYYSCWDLETLLSFLFLFLIMRSQSDFYDKIIRFMDDRNASVSPLKTREIADGCELSVYLARYYLRELNRQHIVEPDRSGKGSAIYWYLVD
ncbi:F1C and S fimbrial switch regulatory protein [Escherichia coli]|nr:F1C and S fimbrial switch regulatory protein [Escherichia coli]